MQFKFTCLSLLLFSSAILSYGYVFDCLDDCECDTDDEVIHCHNKPNRDRLQLPQTRLRGFTVLGLTKNNIKVLPSQELLKEKFPDLVAIDIEGNKNFDCSTLEDQYTKIAVLSDCGKEVPLPDNVTVVETVGPPTPECDLKCQSRRHYDSMHEYFLRLWELIKQKLAELTKQSQFFRDLQDFFTEVGKRISEA
uniref:Uncharacterized protein n=1 Tax=Ditylenchus dipsaci TaxID=166011 RepID=A0A915E744_9BILA